MDFHWDAAFHCEGKQRIRMNRANIWTPTKILEFHFRNQVESKSRNTLERKPDSSITHSGLLATCFISDEALDSPGLFLSTSGDANNNKAISNGQ
jgi:hypothetical protein